TCLRRGSCLPFGNRRTSFARVEKASEGDGNVATDDGRMLDSVAEPARALGNGAAAALAPLETFRERVERLNSKLNAFVTIDMPGAEKAAAEAEKRWKAGQLKSVFDGIPVAVKDLFHVQGVRTTAGSKIFADFVPEDDAAAIARLK